MKRALLVVGLSLTGCSPVMRPEHCTNQQRVHQSHTCSVSEICTTSRCPGLDYGDSQNDLGCRAQEDIFAAIQRLEGVEAWGPWQDCLRGLRPSQLQRLEQIRQGPGRATDTAPREPRPSLVPDLEPGCPDSGDNPSQVDRLGTSKSETTGEWPEDRCVRDADCEAHPNGPYCDLALSRCEPCLPGVAGHCSDPNRPVCDEHFGRRSCQMCSVDLDCVRADRGAHCRKEVRENKYVSQCVACANDEHCAGVPGRPYCETLANGLPPRCVSCVNDTHCGSENLRCDNRLCVGCSSLEGECHAKGACWWWPGIVGTCSDRVLFVDATGSVDCLLGDGSEARPFCRLDEALIAVPASRLTTIRLKGDHVLDSGLRVRSKDRVQIVGDTRAVIEIRNPQESLLSVGDDAHLSLSRVELRSPWKHALHCMGASSKVRLDDVRIYGGAGSALRLEGCSMQASRLDLRGIEGFAIELEHGTLRLSSSMLAGNGRSEGDRGGAILLRERSSIELEHVTLAANASKSQAAMIRCEGTDHRIVVRDSILAQMQTPLATNCSEASITALRNWSDVLALVGQGGQFVQDGRDLMRWVRSAMQFDYRLDDPLTDSEDTRQFSRLGRWTPGDSPFDLQGRRWNEGAGFVGATQSSLR